MRWLLAALLALVVLPSSASAHPLGNFTVNHYSRIEPAGDRVRVVYVLDMAEIPTFQEKPRVDPNPELYADQRTEELRRNLRLELDGVPAELKLEQRGLSFPAGQGGLPTLRLEAVFSAPLGVRSGPVELTYRDDNDPQRIGWREIVATPGTSDTTLESATVPAVDFTDALQQYPEDLLSSPLNVREARVTFLPGASAAAAQTSVMPPALGMLDRTRGAFAELASGKEMTPSFIGFALAVAIVLGAAHALQPGHGKTVVAAYLVGSRGTPRHALFLGATVTATHTAGVYALGLVTLFLSQYILPERLYPILEALSGVLVLAIGVFLFGSRLLAAVRNKIKPHGHSHDHGHSHSHPHPHPHGDPGTAPGEAAREGLPGGEAPEKRNSPLRGGGQGGGEAHPVSWKSLLALGISGGLLPCPEALMVLLITIAAHQVIFGLALIVAFSTGLASVLVGFGLLLIYARGFFQRINLNGGLLPRVLPVASALVIVFAGAVLTLQALPQVL